MTMTQKRTGGTLVVALTGSLDTITAPQLAEALKNALNGVNELILDFAQLTYISSAGLRVVRGASKLMQNQGEMTVRGCNEVVREVFEMTGFADVIHLD